MSSQQSSNRSRIDLEFTGSQSVAYRKVVSSNTSNICRIFQIAYKGIFDPYSLCTETFWQKIDSLNSNVN